MVPRCTDENRYQTYLAEVRSELLLLFVIVLYNTYTILAASVYSINTCRELHPYGWYLEFDFDINVTRRIILPKWFF